MTWRAWFIYYLFLAGIVFAIITQILNFVAGWPPNRWRWAGLTLGIVAAASAGIAAYLGKADLQWRRVSESQEAIIAKLLSGTHAEGHFLVLNRQDPEQGQYYMSIAGVCIKLGLNCLLYNARTMYPAPFAPPGLLSFAFDDADHTFVDALAAAGLVTGKLGTLVAAQMFPEGIREGIIIGPKPSPLGPEVWRTNAPEPR